MWRSVSIGQAPATRRGGAFSAIDRRNAFATAIELMRTRTVPRITVGSAREGLADQLTNRAKQKHELGLKRGTRKVILLSYQPAPSA